MSSRTNSVTELVSGRIGTSNGPLLAASSTRAGVAFLYSYMIFHALHVTGRDPWFVTRLSRIPLFGACEAALIAALIATLLGMVTTPVHDKELARLPNILSFTVAAFALEIVLFP